MKSIIKKILLLTLLFLATAAYGQVPGEYLPFISGQTEKGVFLMINYLGSNAILYIKVQSIQEKITEREHLLLVENKMLNISAVKISDIIPGGRGTRTDVQVLEAFHKWETDYQIELDGSTKILKASSVKWGPHQCYITQTQTATGKLESSVIVSLVANDCVFQFSVPLFKKNGSPYVVLTYDEMTAFIKPIVEKMVIKKEPIPFAMLKKLLEAPEEDFPEKFR